MCVLVLLPLPAAALIPIGILINDRINIMNNIHNCIIINICVCINICIRNCTCIVTCNNIRMNTRTCMCIRENGLNNHNLQAQWPRRDKESCMEDRLDTHG